MTRVEELRNELTESLDKAIGDYHNYGSSDEFHKATVHLDYLTATRLYNYLTVPGTWQYYTNEEGKPRWRCSLCGAIKRRNPHDKLFCSRCGKPMKLEC